MMDPQLRALWFSHVSEMQPLTALLRKQPAVAAAIVLWLVTFAACTIAGVPILFKEGLSLADIRRMRATEDEQIDSAIIEHPPKVSG